MLDCIILVTIQLNRFWHRAQEVYGDGLIIPDYAVLGSAAISLKLSVSIGIVQKPALMDDQLLTASFGSLCR